MSGQQTSTFGDPNILLSTLSGAQTAAVQRNQLLNQETQQGIAANNTEVVARAASTLLDPTLYPTEEARANAWPGIIGQLKANGYAPNAPEAYPGLDHLKATAQLGISTMDRYKLGLNTSPGTQAILDRVFGTGGTTPQAGGGGATGGTGDGLTGDKAHDLPLIAQRESGGSPTVLNYVAQQDPTAYARGATASGKYQIVNSTWREGMQLAGLDPAQYATARDAPEQVQDKVASAIYDKYGNKPWQKGPRDWVKDEQGRYQMATVRPPAGSPGGVPSTPPPGGPGAPGAPPGVQMGGPVPPPPGGAPGAYPTYGAGVGAVVGQGVRPNIGGPVQTVASPPVIKAQPIPAGRTASNADVIMGGVQQAQATPLPPGTQVAGPPMVASTQPTASVAAEDLTPTPARYAGAAPPPAPTVEAPPQAGWGSQVGTGYGPQNALAPSAVQPPARAQPPAQPAAQQPPAPAQQPPAPTSGLGANSPQYQQGLQYMRQAAAIKAMPGYQYNPQLQAAAAYLEQLGQGQMKLETFRDLGGGMQQNVLTGETKYGGPPTARSTTDNAGNTWILNPGQPPQLLHGNVSGVTGSGPEASALRTINEVGPKIADGTATPQQRTNYATAVETYRQPVLKENPVTKETVRVNTRELPAWAPEPPGLGGGGPGGAAGPGGSNVVMPGLSPAQQEIERNKGRYEIAADDLKHDRGEISAIGDAGRSAQQDNLRVQEMRDILTNASTGPGTETAAHLRAWIAKWTPGQLSAWDGSGANLSNPAAIEMFQKLGFVGAVTQERGSTPRGGYQATQLFQKFNPGAQLLTSTNQGLLAQRLIANQAEEDYAQAAQDHYNTQRKRLKSSEQEYDPLSEFDAKWQAQRNPQVYAAAIGALGGQDGDMWSSGLSKDEIQRVKDVVGRADPKAVINMPGDAPTGKNRPPLTSFQR